MSKKPNAKRKPAKQLSREDFNHAALDEICAGVEELQIPFDARELPLYRSDNEASIYRSVRWKLKEGRGRCGEFPLVVVRKYYLDLGYAVLASEPRLPDGQGFILISYPGYRERRDLAYTQMANLLDTELAALDDLNRKADEAKIAATGNRGGGDPDLFVYKTDHNERFFVEVKWKDQLTNKQLVTFPIIRKQNWEVKVARIVAKA